MIGMSFAPFELRAILPASRAEPGERYLRGYVVECQNRKQLLQRFLRPQRHRAVLQPRPEPKQLRTLPSAD
jgi:hypothetical protein